MLRFDLFIADLFGSFDGLAGEMQDREYVIAASRRALAVLRAYEPGDEGEEILIETAIDQFEDLIRRAGGMPWRRSRLRPAPPLGQRNGLTATPHWHERAEAVMPKPRR